MAELRLNSTSLSQGGDQQAPSAQGTVTLKSEINELINQDTVVIFSKENCPYCVDAKNVFEEIGQSYVEVDLNKRPNGSKMQDFLKEMTGAATVPRVFVDGQCIGGGSDTVAMFKNGQLKELLKTTKAAAEKAEPPKPKAVNGSGFGEFNMGGHHHTFNF